MGEKTMFARRPRRARLELLGQERQVSSPSPEERIPEEERWDPDPGSAGHEAQTEQAWDEQTFAERLVEEGAEEAEHNKALRATRQRKRPETR